VIIAQGVMGAWLVELLAEDELEQPDGIVLISAYYPNQTLNKKLAEQLILSPRTIDAPRANIMKKLEINKVTGLVRFAIKSGLVS